MLKRIFNITIFIGIILFQTEISYAQYLAMLSDEDCIELAIDMIRKGVQQEDTTKISMILSNQIMSTEKVFNDKHEFLEKCQNIFNESSKRKMFIKRIKNDSINNQLKSSNLWDFDIISTKINILGDSAFVDCELVLWGAKPGSNKQIGFKIKERFTFLSPQRIQSIPETDNFIKFNPKSKYDKYQSKGWILVKFDNFLNFLNNYGNMSLQKQKEGGNNDETK